MRSRGHEEWAYSTFEVSPLEIRQVAHISEGALLSRTDGHACGNPTLHVINSLPMCWVARVTHLRQGVLRKDTGSLDADLTDKRGTVVTLFASAIRKLAENLDVGS